MTYRSRLDLYALALDRGLSDNAYVDLVAEADQRVREVAGVGFTTTPLVDLDLGGAFSGGPPPVVAKVETGSVGGSHKARHLFGLLLRLLIDDADGATDERPLAIASCGNAALGAALVARSAKRRLQVFVPVDADPAVLAELDRLSAETTVCERRPGHQGGDPCVVALDQAVADGSVAFTVQGTRVPEVIDGCRTLGLELAAQLAARRLEPARVFVQIGGGALATATMDGLMRGRPGRRPPPLHPVQAERAHPYVACWHRAVPALLAERGLTDPGDDGERARLLAAAWTADDVTAFLRSSPSLMTAWPDTPQSVATGILDDVTYDWVTVMAHQVVSGGWPVTVTEDSLVAAADLAGEQVQPAPDETGAAGLAGLLTLLTMAEAPSGLPTAAGEVNVVLLTGVRRAALS